MSAETIELEAGMDAPLFDAIDSTGAAHELNKINAEGYGVILYFYPKDSTPGCTVQACDFRDQKQIFQDAGYVILGVSKDSAKSHDSFIDKQNLNFPLLMDEDLSIHQAYGVWREKKNYGRTYMGTSRSTFIISNEGILQWVGYNVKAKGHVDRILKELNNE